MNTVDLSAIVNALRAIAQTLQQIEHQLRQIAAKQ